MRDKQLMRKAVVHVFAALIALGGCRGDGQSHDEKGLIHLNAGRYTEAIEEFEKVLELTTDPERTSEAKAAIQRLQ